MHHGRSLQKTLWRVRQLKTWQLLIIVVLLGFVAAIFLRLNNVGMVERRSAVLASDNEGIEANIAARLYDLQRYTAAHMNANTGVFYLEQQYNRDVEKAIAKASKTSSNAASINKKVDAVCRPRYSGNFRAYAQCFASELNKYPSGKSLQNAIQKPSTRLYQHEYVSPLWSPDFAGFSILACIIVIMVILSRLIIYLILKFLLKKHYASV